MSIPPQVNNFLANIDKQTAGTTILHEFERQTGLPRSYAVIVGGVVYLIAIFVNVGGIGELLSNIAGFVVPAYYSLLALLTATTKDDTQLLTYWVVFAFLNVVEFWSKAILYWIPFYWLFKTVFLLYIAVPSTGGAQMVFDSLVKPIADRHVLKRNTAAQVSSAAGASVN